MVKQPDKPPARKAKPRKAKTKAKAKKTRGPKGSRLPKRKPKTTKEPGTMGRSKIAIDWEDVDALCGLQCTGDEISAFLGCDRRTLERRVKEEHGVTFAVYAGQKGAAGKISLRRRQWRAAESGDRVMLIWLGKQWLGQTDKVENREVGTGKVINLVMPDNGKGPKK